MEDVRTKTILINSDGTWDFRTHLWLHAFDLYPLNTGVDFIDTVQRGDAQQERDKRSYRGVIGNFPEDFSEEADTLVEELSELVAELSGAAKKRKYLNFALIVGAADFDLLTKGAAADFSDLSAAGRSGVTAFLKTMEAVDAQGDADEQDILGRGSSRVWFSLIVREAGANTADMRRGTEALARLTSRTTGLHTIFYLSEGRQQDGPNALTAHFAKLRLLVDIFRNSPADEVQNNLRPLVGRARRADLPRIFWVRLPGGPNDALTESDLLRRELIKRYQAMTQRESRVANENWRSEFHDLRQELRRHLPGLKDKDAPRGDSDTEAYSLERAKNAVLSAARNQIANLDESVEKAVDAEQEIQNITRQLSRGRLGFVYSYQRLLRIETLASEYDAALDTARRDFSSALTFEIDRERAAYETDRKDLNHVLQNVKVPTTPDAQDDVEDYCRDVLNEAQKQASAQIAQAHDDLARRDALEDTIWKQMSEERAKAVTDLLTTERSLMRPRATIMIILGVSLVALLPMIAVQFVFQASGRGTGLSFFGPASLILSFSLGIAILFAILTPVHLARVRNIALRRLRGLLDAQYDTLKVSSANLVRIAVNRARLSIYDQALSAFHPRLREGSDDQSEAFIAVLTSEQNKLPPQTSTLDQTAMTAIEDAIKAKGTRAEKIGRVLTADLGRPVAGRLEIEAKVLGATGFTLATTATQNDVRLVLAGAGDA